MKLALLFASLCSSVTLVTSFTALQPRKYTPSRTWSTLFAELNGDITPKKVIVLGGDGFCGWPTSLYLSDQGHDIIVVDNLSRRNIDIELGCDSLTPIQAPEVSSDVCCIQCRLFEFLASVLSWCRCSHLSF